MTDVFGYKQKVVMSKPFCLLPLLWTIVHSPLLAQEREMPAHQIPEVTIVKTNHDYFSEDHPIIRIEPGTSVTRQESLGAMLERESPVIVRSYGAAGSLMSVSLRGTGSNHTQVNWNGFPLNSPTTGQADLSLVPAIFMQNVGIIQGASGALFGSGTFGGSINLGNSPDWENRFSAEYVAHAGSFGTFGNSLLMSTGNGRFQYHLSVSSSRSRNDFLYRDDYSYGTPIRRSVHNGYLSRGIIQNLYVNLGNGHYLEGGLWIQQKSKEMPVLMGSYPESNALQRDSLFRSFISYRKSGEKSAFVIRSAWFSDALHYTDKLNASDSAFSIDSRISARRWMNTADYRHYFTTRIVAGGGISYNRTEGISRNYGGSIRENEVTFYGSAKLSFDNWVFNAGIRKELYNDVNPPIQYSLGLRFRAGERFTLRSDLSSKFRKPTFNEKYWTPGGNPGLNSEKGWGGSVSGEWALLPVRENNPRIDVVVDLYFQHVDNWIQWVLRDSLTPVEYKQVHTAGFDSRLRFELPGKRFSMNGFIHYTFSHAVVMDTYDDNPLYNNRQMIYVPRHSFKSGLTGRYR
jgi:outer membrane cobalamin receptor